jgi:phage recombination protein Bet
MKQNLFNLATSYGAEYGFSIVRKTEEESVPVEQITAILIKTEHGSLVIDGTIPPKMSVKKGAEEKTIESLKRIAKHFGKRMKDLGSVDTEPESFKPTLESTKVDAAIKATEEPLKDLESTQEKPTGEAPFCSAGLDEELPEKKEEPVILTKEPVVQALEKPARPARGPKKGMTFEDLKAKLEAFCGENKDYKLDWDQKKEVFLVNKIGQPPITVQLKDGKPLCNPVDFGLQLADFKAGIGNLPALIQEDSDKIKAIAMALPGDPANMTGEMIRDFINPLASPKEIINYLVQCKNLGVNPFIPGESFLIKTEAKEGKASKVYTIIGRGFFRKKLYQHSGFKSIKSGIVVQKKDKPDADFIFRESTLYSPKSEELVGGWAEILMEDREPVRVEVSFHEYDAGNQQWQKRGATMIAKVAEVQASRAAIPDVFEGMYSSEEMGVTIKADPNKEIVVG